MSDSAFIKPTKRLPFYNFNRLYSFESMWKFCIGGRGLGKTYGAKKKAIKDAIFKGKEFIYLRRYTKELKTKSTFMADLSVNKEFEDYDFRMFGNQLQWAHVKTKDEKQRPWKVAGYFLALSTAQFEKGTSYANVYTIIFDEFIIEKGLIRYIDDEAVVMQNFYNTVDRWEDRVRVLFLANSISINNPYFIFYDIEPKPGDEWIQAKGGYVTCHFPDSDEFKNQVYKTKFGKFIAETDYADYAVGNGFKDNNDNLILLKNSEANYAFTLETKKGMFSVWRDHVEQNYHIQERRPKQEVMFTMVPENMTVGKRLLFKNDKLVQALRTAFTSESVFFDKPRTRQIFIDIFS